MNTRNVVILSGVMLVVAMMLNMNFNIHAAAADTKPVGGGPGTDLEIFFLKKSFDFCDDGLSGGKPTDPPGGSPPDGFDVQSSGCVDRWVGQEQDRRDNYAFTGEQIAELVVARDLNGAIGMTYALMQVGSADVVYCNDVTADFQQCVDTALGQTSGSCGSFYGEASDGTVHWMGHEIYDADKPVSGILAEYPPQKSESTHAGFDPLYDKIYECFLTVTDEQQGQDSMTVTVYDTVNDEEATTPEQIWFFNPEVSLDISLSSGHSIAFEDGYAGDTVYSTNSLLIENGAEGGVDIAVWLGGTDLSSPDMAAKCPYSNVLDVEGIDVNHNDHIDPYEPQGMHFRCTLDNGIYVEQEWQQVENKNSKEKCEDVSDGKDGVLDREHCLDLHPLFYGHENVLENGHEAECWFKLQYPVPCIGEFTGGNLIILMRAI